MIVRLLSCFKFNSRKGVVMSNDKSSFDGNKLTLGDAAYLEVLATCKRDGVVCLEEHRSFIRVYIEVHTFEANRPKGPLNLQLGPHHIDVSEIISLFKKDRTVTLLMIMKPGEKKPEIKYVLVGQWQLEVNENKKE